MPENSCAKKRWGFLLLALLLVLPLIAAVIDYALFTRGKDPLFALHTMRLKDGGTEVHCGILHDVVDWHRQLPPSEDEQVPRYRTGKEFHFFQFSLFGGRVADPSPGQTRVERAANPAEPPHRTNY